MENVYRGLIYRGCPKQSCQLNVYDYLADIPGNAGATDFVEVQFKNTRKGFYHNSNNLPLEKGDVVAVEASPGHDIGTVTLTGKLVLLQMKRTPPRNPDDIKRIYRKVRPVDMEKYEEAKAREHETMIRSRQIAKDLGLEMKIGDVEYQGDGSKAIFYYIADERVDFRQLIRVYAETFRVRIEMKQIGARQEAGRIGGFGPCGRELCCSTWMGQFCSVGTNAARVQNLSPNPQKLAGLCAKLKCCLNYELDTYQDSLKGMPARDIQLETLNATYYLYSVNPLRKEATYSSAPNMIANLQVITFDRANEVIALNRKGVKPDSLGGIEMSVDAENTLDYENVVGQDSLTRFDKKKKKKNKGSKGAAANTAEQKKEETPTMQKPRNSDVDPNADSESIRENNQPGRPENRRNDRRNHPNRTNMSNKDENDTGNGPSENAGKQPSENAPRKNQNAEGRRTDNRNNRGNRNRNRGPRDNQQREQNVQTNINRSNEKNNNDGNQAE